MPAENILRVNDYVLLGAGYPRTYGLLGAEGFELTLLPVETIGRLDAGLTCMSLLWRQRMEPKNSQSPLGVDALQYADANTIENILG